MNTSPCPVERRRVLVYLGATMPQNILYVQAVQQLGEEIARRDLDLVFGGSREGTMTVLCDAVLQNGGRAIGVFPKTLPPNFLYGGLTETHITPDILERKRKMLELADVVIAMPGSFGTWDELFDALEQEKVEVLHGRPPKPIGILNLLGYYDGVLQLLDRSILDGYTTKEYRSLLTVADTVPELLDACLANQADK